MLSELPYNLIMRDKKKYSILRVYRESRDLLAEIAKAQGRPRIKVLHRLLRRERRRLVKLGKIEPKREGQGDER